MKKIYEFNYNTGNRQKYGSVHRYLIVLIVLTVFAAATLGVNANAYAKETAVKIGYQPALCQPAVYVAIDKKMFERNGIKTKNLIFTAGPPMISAFKNREIDIGFLGAPPAISAMDKGINISIYGWSHVNGSSIVVRKDSGLNRVEDLKGKQVAVPMFGSIQDVLTRMVLEKHGLKPGKDVKLMEAGELGGVSQLPTMLKRRTIDGYVAWPYFDIVPIVEGYGKALLKPDEMIPNNPCCVIAIHNDFAKEHPELMKQSLRIFDDAATFTMAYPEEAAKSIQNVAGFKYEIATASMKYNGQCSFKPSEESIQTTMEILSWMKKLGYIKGNLTRDRVFALEYAYEIHPGPVLEPGKVGPRPEVYKRVMGK
jgi:NitT/TauT family transport system substrate-binding protein